MNEKSSNWWRELMESLINKAKSAKLELKRGKFCLSPNKFILTTIIISTLCFTFTTSAQKNPKNLESIPLKKGTLTIPQEKKQENYITLRTATRNLRVPAPKEGPPYKIGDIIGYSEEGMPEVYIDKVVVAAEWGSKIIKEKPKIIHPDTTYDTFELLYLPEKPNEIGKKEWWETFLPAHFQSRLNIDMEKRKREGLIKEINGRLYWLVNFTLIGGPSGVKTNKEGNIFIIDEISGQIKEYTPEGSFVSVHPLSLFSQIDSLRQVELQNWKKDIIFEQLNDFEGIIKIKNLKKKLKNVPKDEITIKVQSSGLIQSDPYFLGIDNSNNLYFMMPIYQEEYEIYKYTLNGKLLVRIKGPVNYLNEKGEMYQLLNLDKCYIIKRGSLK